MKATLPPELCKKMMAVAGENGCPLETAWREALADACADSLLSDAFGGKVRELLRSRRFMANTRRIS
jgi:hypothetical protein